MKLFTKIFLQVACVILILSSAVFFYTSYRWKNQSIQYINNYEYTKFQNNLLQFEEKLRLTSSQSANSDEKVRNRILIYAFRQIFHDSAVLYQNDEELYNGTAYDFDVQGIQEQLGEVELHGKWYDADTYICDPLISKADGKTLLLFFYSSTESTTNLNYQIVTYKDVSDVLESNRILFYQAGMLTLVLLLLTGTILFFSLRKIMAPLTKLREAAVSVSEGNYDIQVPAEGDTELAQVGKSFNQMSSKVKEQIECLSTVNHTQRQLMGSLAHELKTPMTTIAGFVDGILDGTIPEEKRGMVAPHETTHAMKQLGYKPYLDFVRRTAEYFDETTVFGDKLVKFVGKHRGFDSLPTNEADRVTFFDELNAIIYGHYASGKMDGLDGPLHQAFRDFDRYIEELDNIHKQFKNRSDKPISPSGENGKAKPARAENPQQQIAGPFLVAPQLRFKLGDLLLVCHVVLSFRSSAAGRGQWCSCAMLWSWRSTAPCSRPVPLSAF